MSEEYIKRSDAINAVEAREVERNGYGRTEYDQGRNDEISYISDVVIPDIPAADVVPVVHGKWLTDDDPFFPKCSVCGGVTDWRSNYCPDCGAKMHIDDDVEYEDENYKVTQSGRMFSITVWDKRNDKLALHAIGNELLAVEELKRYATAESMKKIKKLTDWEGDADGKAD